MFLRAVFVRSTLIYGLLLISLGFMWQSVREESATCDEFEHLISGYAFLRQIDLHQVFTDNVGSFIEAPPLIKSIAAVPLLFMQVELPQKSRAATPPLATNYFYSSKNNPDRLLLWGRLPMLLLFGLLALLIKTWAGQLYGAPAGYFAFLLAVFNIPLMASGRYVMIDVGIALFYTLSIYTFLRCLQRPSVGRKLIAGVTFGLAQVAKSSALVLFPTFLAIAVVYYFRDPENQISLGKKRHYAMQLLQMIVVLWLVGGVVITAAYSLQTWNMPQESQAALNQKHLQNLPISWPAAVITKITAVSRPLGYYALSLAVLSKHNAHGHLSYLFGHVAKSQGWLYFPVAFLLKTQLSLIILLCLAPFLIDREKPPWQGQMLLLSALIYALVAMSAHINIGIRHLLPLYPLLIIWVSQIIYWPIQRHPLNVSKAIVLTGLACWYIFDVASAHPHYLAYFNALAGGSSNGYRYLSDSNVDHGQDIKRLGAYLNAAGIKDVTVLCAAESSNLWGCPSVTHYMPNATPWDPRLLTSSSNDLPTGFFVVSKTPRWLTGELLTHHPQALGKWQEMEAQLQNIVPLATIGYSVDLYYLSKSVPLHSKQCWGDVAGCPGRDHSNGG